jgi:hypothetical protein
MATMGQPQPPVKKSNTGRRILIIVIILALACIVCVGGVLVIGGPAIGNVFNSVVGITTSATDFMTALKNNDYTKAYSLVVEDQQQAFGGSPDGMQQLFQQNGWSEPTNWTFNSTNVNNDQATLAGDVNFKSGGSKRLAVHLRNSGGTWKVMGFGPAS